MCGGFYSCARRTGPGKHGEIRYLMECGRIDGNVASYQHVGGAIAVEITKENLEGAV